MPSFTVRGESPSQPKFFLRAQLFGFTGTPIFDENATHKKITGDLQTLKITKDLFQDRLYEYTIPKISDITGYFTR